MDYRLHASWQMTLTSAIFAILLGSIAPSSAAVLYENAIQNNDTGNALFGSGAIFGAENFSLSSNSTVEELVAFVAAQGDLSNANISVAWKLYTDVGTLPGTLLGSGSSVATFTDTGLNLSCCSSNSIYSMKLDINDTALLSGAYWVAFHVDGFTLYWADTSDGDHQVAQSNDGGATWMVGYGVTSEQFKNRGFQILGSETVNAVPLPAAFPLFATGLGVIGLIGWRRKRKAAALAT